MCHQNNYIGILNITSNAIKSFDILTTNLIVLHIVMVEKIIFRSVSIVKFFNTSAKLFFSYKIKKNRVDR